MCCCMPCEMRGCGTVCRNNRVLDRESEGPCVCRNNRVSDRESEGPCVGTNKQTKQKHEKQNMNRASECR